MRKLKLGDHLAGVGRHGPGISVTTLQLAQAAAVVANGGLLVRPRLVLKKGGKRGAAGGARPRSSGRKPPSPCAR